MNRRDVAAGAALGLLAAQIGSPAMARPAALLVRLPGGATTDVPGVKVGHFTDNPVHTLADGNALFCLCNGRSGRTGNMQALSVLVAQVTEAAVLRAILKASAVAGPGVAALRTAGELVRGRPVAGTPRHAAASRRDPAHRAWPVPQAA